MLDIKYLLNIEGNKMMKISHLSICLALGMVCVPSGYVVPAVQAAVQGIAAVVNEDAISVRDLEKRLRLIMASSGLPNNKEIREKMAMQVLSTLVNEKLMMQEARKHGLVVVQADIERGFSSVAQQNKMSADQFRSMLKKGGIDEGTMKAQIESQVAWSKVVQSRLRQRVVVSDRDVDDVLERLTAKVGTTEYLTAEIFLPIDDAKSAGKVKQLASRLVREIKGGKASFFKVAQQFSKSAGSANGGDIGWVNEEQVSEEVLAGLRAIKKNQVSAPIKTHEGYRILFVRDTRTLSENTLPSRDQVHYNLGAERLDKIQRRYLLDLRAAAFIDVRV